MTYQCSGQYCIDLLCLLSFSALYHLSFCFQDIENYQEALPLLQEAVEVMRKKRGDSNHMTLTSKLTCYHLSCFHCKLDYCVLCSGESSIFVKGEDAYFSFLGLFLWKPDNPDFNYSTVLNFN